MAGKMETTIYHNPACGTSRNALALLRATDADPRIVEYLVNPPTRELITQLAERIGLPLREIMRKKGTPYAELNLDDPALQPDELLDAIEAHPILLNRPIVVGPTGAKLCRPSDVVLDLLPLTPLAAPVLKEEGVPFLRDVDVSPADRGLHAALTTAGLSVDDLVEPHQAFYAFDTLDGKRLGYGGFQRHGEIALIRSVVVADGARQGGIGSNIVPLLLFRAFEAGSRRAYLLTSSAAPFFAKLGFRNIERANAPEAILSTRQAASICPASAHLMSRELGL